MGLSGADLEYQRMLREAGRDPSNPNSYKGADAGILEQESDMGGFVTNSQKGVANGFAGLGADGKLVEGQVPTRLDVTTKTITDWNTALDNGWYKGYQGVATNSPDFNKYYYGQVIQFNVAWVQQTVYEFDNSFAATATIKAVWRRELNTTTWTAWNRVQHPRSELDALYLGENGLPSRLIAKGISTAAISNIDTLVASGFYYSNDTVRRPVAGLTDYFVQCFVYDNGWAVQIAHDFRSDRSWRRRIAADTNGGAWSAWVELPIGSQTITDLNNARHSGWYVVNPTTANRPWGGAFTYGLMEHIGNSVVDGMQTAYLYHDTGVLLTGATAQVWRRNLAGNTFSAWYRVRDSELELDSLYKGDNGLPARLIPLTSNNNISDPNTAVTSGFYAWGQAPSGFGFTPTAYGSALLVVAFDSNYITQTATVWDLNRIFMRTKIAGVWSSWREVATSMPGESMDSGWHMVGGGGEPAFQNSWVNYDGLLLAGFRKVGKRVFLKGVIKSGVVGTTAFTLPVGYRPSQKSINATISNATIGDIDIFATGEVNPAVPSNNVWVSLDNISFFVD